MSNPNEFKPDEFEPDEFKPVDFQSESFRPEDSASFQPWNEAAAAPAAGGEVLMPGGPATARQGQVGAGDDAGGMLGPGPAIKVGGSPVSGTKKKQPGGKRGKLPLLLAGGGLLAVLGTLGAGAVYFFTPPRDEVVVVPPVVPPVTPPQPGPTSQPGPATQGEPATPGPVTPAEPPPAEPGPPAKPMTPTEPPTPSEPSAPVEPKPMPPAASPLDKDFAVIEGWSDADLRGLDPLNDEFFNTPLGRLYDALRSGKLSFADEQRLRRWVVKMRTNTTDENALLVLEIVENSFELTVPVTATNPARLPSRRGIVAESPALPAWGLLSLFAPRHLLAGVLLQPPALDLSPPDGMSAKDLKVWQIRVRFFEQAKDELAQVSELSRLAAICLQYEAFDRALAIATKAREILTGHTPAPGSPGDRARMLSSDLSMLRSRAELGSAVAAFANAGAATSLSPNKVRDLLTQSQARIRLDRMAPDLLMGFVAEDRKTAYQTRWNAADAILKKLLDQSAKAPEPTKVWQGNELTQVQQDLQTLESELLGLQIDFAVLAVPPGGGAPPLVWNREEIADAVAALEARWTEVKKKLTDKRLADSLAPVFMEFRARLADVAAISPDEGAELLVKLQRLVHDLVQVEIAQAMEEAITHIPPPTPGGSIAFRRDALRQTFDALGLTDERLRQLNPSALPEVSWRTDHARLVQDVVWLRSQLQPAQAMAHDAYAAVVARLDQVIYTTLRLETALKIAAVSTPGSPPVVPPRIGCQPGYQDSMVGLAAQLADLQSVLARLSQDNARLERGLIGLRSDLDRVAHSPRPIPPEQLEEATANATQRVLDTLAAYGYTPPAGAPPAASLRVDPNLPDPNPRLAREYAGTAFTLYYSGRSDELSEAIELFGLAVRHDASNPVYRYFLGLCLYRLGRASEAASQVRAGRDFERQSPDLHRPDSALARVQGPLRDWLESIRRGA